MSCESNAETPAAAAAGDSDEIKVGRGRECGVIYHS